MTSETWHSPGSSGVEDVVRPTVVYAAASIVGICLGGVVGVLVGDIPLAGVRILLGYVTLLASLPLGAGVVEGMVVASRLLRSRQSWVE